MNVFSNNLFIFGYSILASNFMPLRIERIYSP